MRLQSEKNFLSKEKFKVLDWEPYKKFLDFSDIKKKHKKICLQVDGGGILGILPSYMLYSSEFNKDESILKNIDYLWGCSVGSIIVGLLNLGFSTKKILNWFIELGPKVFHSKFLWGGLIGSIYTPVFIENELKKHFKDITFKEMYEDTNKELNIAVVDINKECTKILNYKNSPDFKIWAAVRASMSAPVYFPKFTYEGVDYFDGGSGTQTCLAVKSFNDLVYKKKLKNFYLISLGCGYGNIGIPSSNKLSQAKWVFQYMRKESVSLQEKFLKYRAKDNNLKYTRWNIELSSILNKMDETDNINELIELIDK